MRLTLRTDLAARVLMFCAAHDGRQVRSAEIAAQCNASVNHLLQVISLLQINGFVTTTRGRSGGLRLSRPMEQISIGAVFRRVEGDLPLTECFDAAANSCPLLAACRLRGVLSHAQEAFYRALDAVTLADLVQGNCALAGFLGLAAALQGGCPSAHRPADPAIAAPFGGDRQGGADHCPGDIAHSVRHSMSWNGDIGLVTAAPEAGTPPTVSGPAETRLPAGRSGPDAAMTAKPEDT